MRSPARSHLGHEVAALATTAKNRLQSWSIETIPLSDAKARLSEIADDVDRTHQRVQITKNGRSYVVLISAEDLDSMEATLELLADPAAMERVSQAQVDLAAGAGTSGEQMRELMEQRRRGREGR